ncbi:pyridine nucleotide-disulfide oxidoreductase [Mycobacterium sp. ACS1612]|uniref:NAD(P)/FAD-dependent oxidoreductase n=1 Tax=Mycobacterium sp. ACS1612 TaxID=1834117 RepID=UPI0007FBAF5A|nr:NAD(P)/FAD-dependent oxidoreductase [Mycobacterium sp. ACS1612]OBF26526.1 pyridine nucleotide-disulfide oxidoreductase [Mycobacterium sp. ACS1612]
MDSKWDCVVVGGGAAGLSAGMVLGRARRRTLLIDAGRQSNLAAHGVGGLLGHDGRSPAELYEIGRRELAEYSSVDVRTGEVVSGERVGDLFELKLSDGSREQAHRVVLATGMEYRPPVVKGLEEFWGRSVFHCPFCDGWELRDQPLAVLARGEKAIHSALLLRGWTDDLILLTDGEADLGDDDRDRLTSAGVKMDERSVAELTGRQGQLEAVQFTDGGRLECRGLLAATTLHQRSRLAEQLGAEPGEATPFGETPVKVDGLCRTSAPGVFAAGDLSTQLPPSVASAIAAGSLAGMSVVQSLLADQCGLPVPDWSEHVDA